MSVVSPPKPVLPIHWSLADLQRHLGRISLERIRLHPPPGSATKQDVVDIEGRESRLFELVDGTLVEKTMGWYESLLAGLIVTALNNFLKEKPLGKALTSDGTLEILPNMVRIPDACFIGWERFAKRGVPREPIPPLVPDLAVEVLSKSNTADEMQRKLRDYFEAGVRLVWYVDPESRLARLYTSVDDVTVVAPNEHLDGGDVLPGFRLQLAALFDEADRQGPENAPTKRA
jgi:Uma2 family endonuclease